MSGCKARFFHRLSEWNQDQLGEAYFPLDEYILKYLIEGQREAGLYTVEFVQNAIDGKQQDVDLEIHVRVYCSDQFFIEEIQDNSEGPVDLFDLLCEGEGNKYGREGFLGQFAMGSFLYLNGCDEVDIEVHREGVKREVRLRKDSKGLWQIFYKSESSSSRGSRGVILRRKKNIDSILPEIESSFSHHYWSFFAGSIPFEQCPIYFSYGKKGEKNCLNKKREIVYEIPLEKRDSIANEIRGSFVPVKLIGFLCPQDYYPLILTKGSLYMTPFSYDHRYLALIPSALRPILMRECLMVQVDYDVTRDRSSFKNERVSLTWIQHSIFQTFLSYLASQIWFRPHFKCYGFPEDFFMNSRKGYGHFNELVSLIALAPFYDEKGQVTTLFEQRRFIVEDSRLNTSIFDSHSKKYYWSRVMREHHSLQHRDLKSREIFSNSDVSGISVLSDFQKSVLSYLNTISVFFDGIQVKIFDIEEQQVGGCFVPSSLSLYLSHSILSQGKNKALEVLIHELAHYYEHKQKGLTYRGCSLDVTHQSEGVFANCYKKISLCVLMILSEIDISAFQNLTLKVEKMDLNEREDSQEFFLFQTSVKRICLGKSEAGFLPLCHV